MKATEKSAWRAFAMALGGSGPPWPWRSTQSAAAAAGQILTAAALWAVAALGHCRLGSHHHRPGAGAPQRPCAGLPARTEYSFTREAPSTWAASMSSRWPPSTPAIICCS